MSSGTPMPMKLPSGQVVWVRVSDDETDEPGYGAGGYDKYEDRDQNPYPAPGEAPADYGYGYTSNGYGSGYGNGYTYDDEGSPGSGEGRRLGYVTVPQPPGQSPGGAPGSPGGAPGSAPGAAPQTQETPPLTGPVTHNRFSLRRHRQAASALPSSAAPQELYGFTDAVSGIAESVRAGLQRAAPDKVEIEFGLDIDVTSGVAISLIADARAKAAVRIKLGWDNSEGRRGAAYAGDQGDRAAEGEGADDGGAQD